MTDKERKLFEALSGLFLGIPIGIFPFLMVPGWCWLDSPVPAPLGYLICGICGIAAGFFAGHVYGPRYYLSHIIGLFIAAVGGLAIACSVLSQVNAIPKIGYLAVVALGAAPGLILCRLLKKIQDAIFPPSEAELERHRQIELRRKQEEKAYWQGYGRATVKERLEYRFTVIVLFVLSIVPPAGFLASLVVFSRSESSYGRRVASIGMGLSAAILVVYGLIFLWLNSLDPNAQAVKVHNAPPVVAGPLGNNAPPVNPPAADSPFDYAGLADKMDVCDSKEQLVVLQKLLRIDPKAASAEEVKIVAKTMKKLAFDKMVDREVRRNAIQAMVTWGGFFSIPRLLELIKSDALVRDDCFKALKSLNDPAALDGVAKLFMTDNDCSTQAGRWLDSYGEAAEDAMLKYFPPQDSLLLRSGMEFLGKHGTKKSLAALEKVGKQWLNKDEAAAAIAAINVREREKSKAKQAE